MNAIFSAIMGVVQGLSEFLPISSSGHLLVAEKLLGLLDYSQEGSTLSFYVMLHMGTLFAVAVIFWKDWLHMLAHPIKDKTLLLLFIASLPALFVKILLGDFIDRLFTGWFLGISFLITALFLALIQVIERKKQEQVRKQEPDIISGLTMGVFQGIALFPGVSRSGSTLLGGIISGLDRRTAAKFSFMMSAPAILVSFLSEGKDAIETTGLGSLITLPTLIGMAFAAVSGYFAIHYMLKLIQRISFFKFAVYVAIIGIAVIIIQLTGFAGFPPIVPPGNGG
jgi:undecaprenyl-diphosphatase